MHRVTDPHGAARGPARPAAPPDRPDRPPRAPDRPPRRAPPAPAPYAGTPRRDDTRIATHDTTPSPTTTHRIVGTATTFATAAMTAGARNPAYAAA